MKNPYSSLLSFVSICLVSGARSFAQDEPVLLSPFTVTNDQKGYMASNSISATGIGTQIKDIPANINVITQEFLEDKGITELRYAVNNVSSVDSDSRELNRFTINVRGFPALIQQGGFDNVFLSLENVDRVEIIKGPSAVFNGLVQPGGVINVIKYTPEFKRSAYLESSYGSYNYFYTKLRATGPVVDDKLAYNFYTSYQDSQGRDDFVMDRAKFVSGGLKWTPVKAFTSLLDFEYLDETYLGVPEEQSGSNKAYIAAVQAGTVPYLQTSRTWLNNNPLYGPNALNVDTIATNLVYPYKGFNPIGPDAQSLSRGYNIRWDNTLLVSDDLSINVRGDYNSSISRAIDFNSFRPVAGLTPGQFLINGPYNQVDADNRTLTIKAEAVYKLVLGTTQQNILIGAQDEINKAFSRTLASASVIWNPMTQPPLDGKKLLAANYPNGFPVTPKLATSITRAIYVADQLAAFNDSLHILVGVRETKAENASGLNQTKATPEFGVLYRPIKFLSIYGNYSKTFTPNYVLDANSQQLGPTTGKGYDIGVKTELLDGKLSATIAIYKADYLNIPVEDFPREAETNIRPLYNLGGAQRSAGLEMDVFYSPTQNNQVVASFSNSWEHRTLVSTTVLQDNVPLANVPKYNFNLWDKYSFDTGVLKGAFIGVGMKAVSRMRLHPSYDVGIFGRGYVTFDASAGYSWKTKAGTWSARFNVENLTNQNYFNGVYQLGDPLTVKGTIRWSF